MIQSNLEVKNIGEKLIFEFDTNKSKSNNEKHGISFEEAKALWYNKDAIVVYEKSVEAEDRYSIVSFIGKKCYTGIFTIRNGNIRIISVRRCRKKEQKRYEDETNS